MNQSFHRGVVTMATFLYLTFALSWEVFVLALLNIEERSYWAALQTAIAVEVQSKKTENTTHKIDVNCQK